MSSPDAAMVLFVVAFVLLADLLRLVEVVVDVALCVVQLLRDVRHAQAVILLEHDGLGELGVLVSNGLNRIGDGHPLFELLKPRVCLRHAAHGVNVFIPGQVRQLTVTALRIWAVLAAVLLRARDQWLQLAGDHAAALTVFTAVLGAQLITEKAVGLLVAGRQVNGHTLRAEVPGATLVPCQPHCMKLVRAFDLDGCLKDFLASPFELFQGL